MVKTVGAYGDKDEWGKCVHISHRNFLFGKSEVFPSLGKIIINAKVFDKSDRPIPFWVESGPD